MRRRYRVVVIGALVGLLTAVGAVTPAAAAPMQDGTSHWGEAEEQEFVRLINELRSSQGVTTLSVNLELTAQARIWSETMKGRGDIFHSGDLGGGISANWRKLGENVGVGGTVQALFDAFVASPTHYANLVDPDYRTIGIGVIWDGPRMFTAHRFMAEFPPKAPAPEPPTAPALQSSPSPSPSPTPSQLPANPTGSIGEDAPEAADSPAAQSPVPHAAAPADPARIAVVIRALSSFRP